MLPRRKLEIDWSDLTFAVGRCLWPGSRARAQRRVEESWSAPDAVACLSVRSGFDLLLRALALPRGSEIAVSAVTIRDMIRIIEHHGLVPIPVDLDMETLSLSMESLRRAVGPRTKAILVAHLFGSRMALGEVIGFARQRGLLVIEDCAQAYAGPSFTGHPGSDICMFSFGPIKTATALGGAVLRIGDPALLREMRMLQRRLPVQTRGRFLRRVLRYALLKLLVCRAPFSLFVRLCRMTGTHHDDILSAAASGFPGPEFFTSIRFQPSYPLLALLDRRLTHFSEQEIAQRVEVATAAIRLLRGIRRPGERAGVHFHWVFPIQVDCPDELMRHLWGRGFDATRGASSLHAIDSPADRPDMLPVAARGAMQEVLYLPIYAGVSSAELEELARAVVEFTDAMREAHSAGTGRFERRTAVSA